MNDEKPCISAALAGNIPDRVAVVVAVAVDAALAETAVAVALGVLLAGP